MPEPLTTASRVLSPPAWRRADEQRLSRALVGFAQTLVFRYSIQEILDRLVPIVADVVGVTGAGVVLRGTDEQMHFVSATDDVVLRIEHLQLELGEGPCLRATDTDETVLAPDLLHDDRFPRFSPRAAEAGLAAVYTFPLRGEGACMGALDLYSDTPLELGRQQLAAAQVLADVASVYITNAQTRADAERSENQLRHRLLHDPLTGLPNRMLLDDRIAHAIARSPRSRTLTGVLFLDLDHFKTVNDSFGHRTGDLLLIAVAGRILEVLRPGDTFARLGGDEFAIVCESLTSLEQAEEVAGRIIGAVSEPFMIEGHELRIGVSIGIADAGAREDPDDPLTLADAAMYDAKQRGGGRFQTVDARLHKTTSRRHDIERDLTEALARDELRLHFQPIVDAASSRWDRAEALLRWDHPKLGRVSPDAIVKAANRTGLSMELAEWVTRSACRHMRGWLDADGPGPSAIAINVSATELLHPRHRALVAGCLREYGVPPDALCLEITESILVGDAIAALDICHALKDTGVTLALDDFGTGYSSLSYLKRFPVDIVKIDRSFIAGVADDTADQAIVVAIVELAHGLGLTVVAEGVETVRQCDRAIALGCDQIQGHWFSLPVTPDAIRWGEQPLTGRPER